MVGVILKRFWLIGVVVLGGGTGLWLGLHQPPLTHEQGVALVQARCQSCHSAAPTDKAYPVAPAGMILDTKEDVWKHREAILMYSVKSKYMPLMNKTGMTDLERQRLGVWLKPPPSGGGSSPLPSQGL